MFDLQKKRSPKDQKDKTRYISTLYKRINMIITCLASNLKSNVLEWKLKQYIYTYMYMLEEYKYQNVIANIKLTHYRSLISCINLLLTHLMSKFSIFLSQQSSNKT